VPTLVDRIGDIVTPQIEAMDLSVVRIKLFGGRRQVLQIMIERADGGDVTVEECAAASRAVSPLLDVYDELTDAYQLEVSSPGIDRPLTRPRDFERFAGFLTKIELTEAASGRKRFRGILLGLTEDGAVRMDVDGAVAEWPLHLIASAKLVLTDELIAAHQSATDADALAE
jgi:ribosome maturation factor RimP